MTIIQKINTFIKKKYNFLSVLYAKAFKIQNFNPFFLISFLVIFSCIFFLSLNLIDKKNEKNANNLKEITKKSDNFLDNRHSCFL